MNSILYLPFVDLAASYWEFVNVVIITGSYLDAFSEGTPSWLETATITSSFESF